MRRLCIAMVCLGCAPVYRSELVANGRSWSEPGRSAVIKVEVPVESSGNSRKLKWVLHLPRALQLDYDLDCPGFVDARYGVEGETAEDYRRRRLSELQRQRQAQANAIGALVGTLAPRTAVGIQAKTPSSSTSVHATMDPGLAASAAAMQAMPEVQLPAWDVGARDIEHEEDISAASSGKCVLAFKSHDQEQELSGVIVDANVIRLVDVEAERRAQTEASRASEEKVARALRADLLVRLVTSGADPGKRARDLALAEAERCRQVQVRQSAQQRIIADRMDEIMLRFRIMEHLLRLGADPAW
jgi:hypothetical protein